MMAIICDKIIQKKRNMHKNLLVEKKYMRILNMDTSHVTRDFKTG